MPIKTPGTFPKMDKAEKRPPIEGSPSEIERKW